MESSDCHGRFPTFEGSVRSPALAAIAVIGFLAATAIKKSACITLSFECVGGGKELPVRGPARPQKLCVIGRLESFHVLGLKLPVTDSPNLHFLLFTLHLRSEIDSDRVPRNAFAGVLGFDLFDWFSAADLPNEDAAVNAARGKTTGGFGAPGHVQHIQRMSRETRVLFPVFMIGFSLAEQDDWLAERDAPLQHKDHLVARARRQKVAARRPAHTIHWLRMVLVRAQHRRARRVAVQNALYAPDLDPAICRPNRGAHCQPGAQGAHTHIWVGILHNQSPLLPVARAHAVVCDGRQRARDSPRKSVKRARAAARAAHVPAPPVARCVPAGLMWHE